MTSKARQTTTATVANSSQQTKENRNQKIMTPIDTIQSLAKIAGANAAAVSAKENSQRAAVRLRYLQRQTALPVSTFTIQDVQLEIATHAAARNVAKFGALQSAKRKAGETTLGAIHTGAKVLHRIRPTMTNGLAFAHALEIETGESKGGVNPQHDAYQIRHDRESQREKLRTFADHMKAFAFHVVEKHIRKSKMECGHLAHEMEIEVMSSLGEFMAVRISRFPTLAADLMARWATGILPNSTRRALYRCAYRACDNRMRRMSGSTKLVDTCFFNMFMDDPERSAELDMVFINARIDMLADKVRMAAGPDVSGHKGRALKAHIHTLDIARAAFIASVKGEPAKLPNSRALRLRLYRMARYVGEMEIIVALGRGQSIQG